MICVTRKLLSRPLTPLRSPAGEDPCICHGNDQQEQQGKELLCSAIFQNLPACNGGNYGGCDVAELQKVRNFNGFV